MFRAQAQGEQDQQAEALRRHGAKGRAGDPEIKLDDQQIVQRHIGQCHPDRKQRHHARAAFVAQSVAVQAKQELQRRAADQDQGKALGHLAGLAPTFGKEPLRAKKVDGNQPRREAKRQPMGVGK